MGEHTGSAEAGEAVALPLVASSSFKDRTIGWSVVDKEEVWSGSGGLSVVVKLLLLGTTDCRSDDDDDCNDGNDTDGDVSLLLAALDLNITDTFFVVVWLSIKILRGTSNA